MTLFFTTLQMSGGLDSFRKSLWAMYSLRLFSFWVGNSVIWFTLNRLETSREQVLCAISPVPRTVSSTQRCSRNIK